MPGLNEGFSDAMQGRSPQDNGDEEYYIAYNRERDYQEQPTQPDPREQPDPRDLEEIAAILRRRS